MAPKRQRVSSAGAGSSRPAAFDAVRFMGHAQEARYKELEERNIWTKRSIRLREHGHYSEVDAILSNYGLGVLFEPQTKVNVELVREFYANYFPAEGSEFRFASVVRGKLVSFSRTAINSYWGLNWTAPEDQLDVYHEHLARGNWDFNMLRSKLCLSGHSYELNRAGQPLKFNRSSLKTSARVLMCVALYNLRPRSHTYSIPMETVGLIAYMLDEEQIDFGRLIANELKRVALSYTSRGERIKCALTYPGLIMGLLKRAKVVFPAVGHLTIDGVIDDSYCDRYCRALDDNSASQAVPVAVALPQASPSEEWNRQMHLAHQRAFMFMHDSMEHLALQIREPGVNHFTRTGEQLRAYAGWPGVGPNAEEEVGDEDDGEESSGSGSDSGSIGDSILEADDC